MMMPGAGAARRARVRGGLRTGLSTNVPAGLSPIVYRGFTTIAGVDGESGRGSGVFPLKSGGSEGWDEIESEYVDGTRNTNVSQGTDATAPVSPSEVLSIYYPVGLAQNTGPAIVQTQGFTTEVHGSLSLTEIYTRGNFKLGTGYWVGTVTNKLYFHRTNTIVTRPEPYVRLNNDGAGGYVLQVNMQGTPDDNRGDGSWSGGNITADANGSGIQKNTWYQLETYLKLNSAYGTADGILRVWLNGVKCIEATDCQILPSDNPFYWDCVPHISPTFGGSAAPIGEGEDFYLYFDHFYTLGA